MPTLIARLSFISILILFYSACATAERGSADKVVEASVKSSSYVTLTWEAPTTNTDGSPLTDLAGYNIYYGRVSGKLDKTIPSLALEDRELSCKKMDGGKSEKKGRTECTHMVRGLEGGPYYFAVKAYNKGGEESDFSNEVKK